MFQLLAQSQNFGNGGEAAVGAGILIVAILVGLVIGIGIAFLISWLVYKPYSKVPAEFQVMKPGMVFLLMIPLFGLIWSFFIASQLPQSFKAYFDSVGDDTVGDAGKNIGLAWAICSACSIVPVVGGLAGLAGLVLLIIFIVKLWGFAGRINDAQSAVAPM